MLVCCKFQRTPSAGQLPSRAPRLKSITGKGRKLPACPLSQTLFGNPKEPVELGNPNTCAETKLCLILFYSGSRSSLAMSLKLLYSWCERKLGLVPLKTFPHRYRDHCL